VAALLKALDSRRFSERQEATEALKRLGASALVELERVLEQQPTLEMRKRIEVVVDHVKSRDGCALSVRWRRWSCRAAPRGRKALEDLAKGSPALRTQEARAVLKRMPASR